MRITITKPLFAWEALDDSPSLRTIREFLDAVPDAKLLNALHRWRGRERDDYPVAAEDHRMPQQVDRVSDRAGLHS